MSLPATEFWFSLSVRRNRKSFMLASLLLLLIGVIFSGFFNIHWIFVAIFAVPFTIAQHILIAQRLRDMNVTGWLALLWIPIQMLPFMYNIPFPFGIALLIIVCAVPGTKGPNNYGDDPLQTKYES